MKTAVIAGATGAIGKVLLERLLESNSYSRIVALTRRPLNEKNPKLENVITSFGDESISDVIGKADDVFVTLGTTMKKAGSKSAFATVDYGHVVFLSDMAKRTGASRFLVVSSVGANAGSSNFYLSTKGRMEQSIMASGIPGIYIFRPSLLVARREESRPGEDMAILISKITDFLMVGPLRRYKSIAAEKVAMAMLNAAQNMPMGHFIIQSEEMQ
jgi:uncharacterized protein YbjT (DUF2867 family)